MILIIIALIVAGIGIACPLLLRREYKQLEKQYHRNR